MTSRITCILFIANKHQSALKSIIGFYCIWSQYLNERDELLTRSLSWSLCLGLSRVYNKKIKKLQPYSYQVMMIMEITWANVHTTSQSTSCLWLGMISACSLPENLSNSNHITTKIFKIIANKKHLRCCN